MLVRAPESLSKGCEFEFRQERRENFLLLSQLCVLTLIRCPLHPRVTAVARKRPRSFCQKYRWQVTRKHAYTFDPVKSEWADYAAVQTECGSLSGNELTRNSSGNTRSQSSQLAEPLWTDSGLKSGIGVRELISTKKKNKRRRGMNCRTFCENPRTRGKKHFHHHQINHAFIPTSNGFSLVFFCFFVFYDYRFVTEKKIISACNTPWRDLLKTELLVVHFYSSGSRTSL